MFKKKEVLNLLSKLNIIYQNPLSVEEKKMIIQVFDKNTLH